MLSAAELSKVGSLVALVAGLEAEDTPKLHPLVQWAVPDLVVLQLDQVVTSVDRSEATFRIVETVVAVEGPVATFRTEEAMVVAEVVSDIKVKAKVVDSKLPEAHLEAIAAHPTTLVVLLMVLQMADLAAPVTSHEVVTAVQALQNETVPAVACQWALQWVVGMIRVVVVAHMMTDPEVATVEAVEATIPVQQVVAATWSR